LRQEPFDQASWDEFVERYGRHIYRWCRQWKLQDADAEDVTQDILMKLAEKLRDFRYDPSRSFRSWLKTVTHHDVWRDFEESGRHVRRAAGDSQVDMLMLSLEAREDLARKLEEAFDLELLETAMARVRLPAAYPYRPGASQILRESWGQRHCPWQNPCRSLELAESPGYMLFQGPKSAKRTGYEKP
jgi:RNA polymerase sigma factor (sigma-70 family)